MTTRAEPSAVGYAPRASKDDRQPVAAVPHFLTQQPVYDALNGWLQHIELATLLELHWEAQRRRAERLEREQRRLNDPADMFGKTSEYVAAYYAKPQA